MVAKLPKARNLVLFTFSSLIWESVFISLLFEISSCAVMMVFYVACHCCNQFYIFFTPVQHSALDEHFVIFARLLVIHRKTLPLFIPKFSFSLVSNFAISISMFCLVAITSFPSWELVAFSQSLQHADLRWYEFQLFHLGVLHFSMLCWKGTVTMWKGRSLLFSIYHLRQTSCCLDNLPVRWILSGWALGMAA